MGEGLRSADLLRHSLPGAVVAVYAALAVLSPAALESLAREDSWVEWLTFGFFAAAGAAYAAEAWGRPLKRCWASAGLAAFCLLVAGEEISWGQRLLGFVPPEAFLSGNLQQEANLHNLFQAFLKPKWLVVLVLATWGTAAPLLLRVASERLGESATRLREASAPEDFIPWSLLGAGLLIAYPVDFTGEYVELLTGCLFLLASSRGAARLWGGRAAAAALPLLLALAGWSVVEAQALAGGESKSDCATREAEAVARAISSGGATGRLLEKEHLHKRAFTAVRSGYLLPSVLGSLEAVACPGGSTAALRRSYLIDPWGQPYWIRYRDDDGSGEEAVVVYSFGPNRRRDSAEDGGAAGDDILAKRRPLDEDRVDPGEGSEDDLLLQ